MNKVVRTRKKYTPYIHTRATSYPQSVVKTHKQNAQADFKRVVNGHWEDKKNRRNFLIWAGNQLGVKKIEDWYRVRAIDIIIKGGGGMMQSYYDSSIIKALQDVFPEHQWMQWLFPNCSKRFWMNIRNRRKFLDWFADETNLYSLDEFHKVTIEDLRRKGGSRLLSYYSNLYHLFSSVYPEHQWYPWMFAKVPKGFWNETKNINNFINFIENKLHIKTLDEWNKVSLKDVSSLGGTAIVSLGNTHFRSLLTKCFPEYEYLPAASLYQHDNSREQFALLRVVQELFTDLNLKYNHNKDIASLLSVDAEIT